MNKDIISDTVKAALTGKHYSMIDAALYVGLTVTLNASPETKTYYYSITAVLVQYSTQH